MNTLTEEQRDRMYMRRRNRQMNFDDVAIILNCKKEDIVAAQIGKPINSEVHEAVVDWLEH